MGGVGQRYRQLVALSREEGALRAVLARIAAQLVSRRAWERLGYARLGDYAVECLGLAGRSVRCLAEVGTKLHWLPRLEGALISGTLGWTKVRLLAPLPREEDETRWIARARRMSAEDLSRAVGAVDRGSIEGGAAEKEDARCRRFEVRCTPEVRWKWVVARRAAARAAGRMLHVSEAAELIAAEVLSALPIANGAEGSACDEPGVSWRQRAEASEGADEGDCDQAGMSGSPENDPSGGPATAGGMLSDGMMSPAAPGSTGSDTTERPRPPWGACRAELPPALSPLLEGLQDLDAFGLDERMRRALSLAQSLDARIGAELAPLWNRFLHRAFGYPNREAYTRERLGMDPTRARALVRLERAALASAPFARAYRSGSLSSVRAAELEPLLRTEPMGRFVEDWITWAGRVTVRRLREDVEHALALAETDHVAFGRDGGLPAEARAVNRGDREIGTTSRSLSNPWRDWDDSVKHPEPLKSAPDEVCWARFFGPADIVQLFNAVLCTVRRRIEQDTGRLPTAGAALGVMLDHVLSTWGVIDEKLAASHRIFARDGWRCATPGCSSLQNLHDHHIHFRSAGGNDAPANRITLCAFHHLRGVHAGLLRCVGRAPDGLRWEMGIRPGVTPRLVYRSGDIRI